MRCAGAFDAVIRAADRAVRSGLWVRDGCGCGGLLGGVGMVGVCGMGVVCVGAFLAAAGVASCGVCGALL